MIVCTGNYPFAFAIEHKIENHFLSRREFIAPAGANDEH